MGLRNLMFLLGWLYVSAYADGFQDYLEEQETGKRAQQRQFESFQEATRHDFESYKRALDKAYAAYTEAIAEVWEHPQFSDKKKWVTYSNDKKTAIAFDKQEIMIETIAASKEEAMAKLKTALAKAVTEDTAQAQQSDPWMQQARAIAKSKLGIDAGELHPEPLLSEAVFEKQPTPISVKAYVDAHIDMKKVAAVPSKVKGEKVYLVSVALPSDTMQKRSKTFLGTVKENAKRFELPVPLVFAIMHTESSFNPFARSRIPAYGLMQIVPASAGEDAYLYLHKQHKRPSSSYLYNSANNIEMGSAYLHMLYSSYLRKIENPTSRLYCTIAAYNTGAGNVAYAWTGNHNISEAAKQINRLSPDEVYRYLMDHLKYDEPKLYLDRVNRRMGIYDNMYGDV